MTQAPPRWMALLVVCAGLAGCLLNSVHAIRRAPPTKPDAAHAIVMIGVGLRVPWPTTAFHLTLVEYSSRKQKITGNCFHYNRIEATSPSISTKVTYLAFEVPANVYVLLDNSNTPLTPSPVGQAFVAPPGGAVYFGDYLLADNKSLEFRQDLDAARSGSRSLLPRGTRLEQAETTAAPGAHMPLCTP